MESFGPAAYLMEELLDFASDVGEDDPSSSDAADKIDRSALSHEEYVEEEELEWLSNKDAFPSVDTFVVNPSCVPRICQYKQRSPVSVLESITNVTTSAFRDWFAPVRRARTPRRRRRRHSQQFTSLSQNNSGNVAVTSIDGCSIGRRKCQHCQAEKTPQWRAGPMGAKTLCNACGVRYKSGRLVPEYRPANSPTFSSKLHSNSHRKVVEMRRRKQGCNGGGVVVNATASGG